jgi:hypothetical protein
MADDSKIFGSEEEDKAAVSEGGTKGGDRGHRMRGVDGRWHGEEREAVDFSRRPQEALMSSTEIQAVRLLFPAPLRAN